MGKPHIAVVGSGITGLSIGINLLQRGFSVTLIDKVLPPSGASRAANGALTPYSDTTLQAEVKFLAEETLREFPTYVEWLSTVGGASVDYDGGGVLQPFLPEDEQNLGAYQKLLQGKEDIRWLSVSDTLSLSPNLSPEIIGAIHYVTETRFDVLQLLAAMGQAFARLGGITGVPTTVVRVSATPSGAASVMTPWGMSTFDHAVVAVAGGRVEVQGAPKYDISRVRGEIIELRTPPGSLRQCLYRGDAFLTPRRDGRLLAGTTYSPHVDGMDECVGTVGVEGATSILTAMQKILPGSGAYQITDFWKGWRPTSQDGRPVVGVVEGTPIWIVDGLGGLGYTLSIALSESVAAAVASGVVPPELSAFSPYRFSYGGQRSSKLIPPEVDQG